MCIPSHHRALPLGPLPAGVQEALKLLLGMRRRGINPNETTLNTILDGIVSCQPPRMQEAEVRVCAAERACRCVICQCIIYSAGYMWNLMASVAVCYSVTVEPAM